MNKLNFVKRILCVVLVVLLTMALPACGGKSDELEAPPEVDAEQTLNSEPELEPEPEPEPPIPFTDMPEDASYYDTVVWAYENGIVSDGSTFEPDAACTRAQVITFLWRAAGSPDPQIAENPFSDVSSSAWYYKPVLWAYENAVVTGTAFNPDNSCTNAETLTFLWRAEGTPMAAVYSSPIALADSGAYYARPVAWAENNGMFAGLDSAFDPAAPCRRADIVTYLRWVTEQWTFTEEDKTIQAEYAQIANSERPAENFSSGLLYADYIDVDGDGKMELLTLSGNFGGEFTATIYANIEGHAEKSCEEAFEPLGGRMAGFALCKADGHLYLYLYSEMAYGDAHLATHQFYKVEKGAVTLANDLEIVLEYVEKEDDIKSTRTNFGKEITEDECGAILEKYTDRKEVFCVFDGCYVETSDRGILPSQDEYWVANRERIYAAVLNGDFSYFAGNYEGIDSWEGDKASTSLDKNGVLTGYYYGWEYTTKEPVSITVTESGSIYCVIEPSHVNDEDGTVYGEYLIIYPYGVEYDTDEIRYFGKQYGIDVIRIIYTSLAGFSIDSYQYYMVK